MFGKGMNLETSPINIEHSPREVIIQRPPEEQSFIGTCSQIFFEAQNPIISLNHSCQFENEIFEPEYEGFIFCLSLDSLCLQESDCQTVEDLHQLENHTHVDFIESWFRAIIKPPYFLIIWKLLVPYQLKQLVSHTLVCLEVYSLKLSVSIISILLRTWLQWNSPYT